MKRIGTIDSGGILVEFTTSDVIRLMDACSALEQLFGEVEIQIPAVGTPVRVDGHPVSVTKVEGNRVEVTAIKKTAPASIKKGSKKACDFCGKQFVAQRSDSHFCSKSCTDKSWRAKSKAKSKPAPAKTQVQTKPVQKMDKAARLALIKQAASRVGIREESGLEGIPEFRQAQREAAQE